MQVQPDLISKLRNTESLSVLTGAGISAESGLQTFRETKSTLGTGNALWSKYRPEELATPEAFERNPELVWEFYSMRRLKSGQVKPNPGHYALVEMAKHIQHFTLMTQNIDGLHQKAGSVGVLELHGNITRVKCSRGCGIYSEWDDRPGKVPVCPNCGAKLRPDVVWFGEMLPQKELEAAIRAATNSEVFFSIGTSALVQPAASLALMAKERGSILVEINLEQTPLTKNADYFLQGKSGECLPELVKQVWI
jgi:NAD-dependent deacetylase